MCRIVDTFRRRYNCLTDYMTLTDYRLTITTWLIQVANWLSLAGDTGWLPWIAQKKIMAIHADCLTDFCRMPSVLNPQYKMSNLEWNGTTVCTRQFLLPKAEPMSQDPPTTEQLIQPQHCLLPLQIVDIITTVIINKFSILFHHADHKTEDVWRYVHQRAYKNIPQ